MTSFTDKIIRRFLRCCYSCGELGTTPSQVLCKHCEGYVSQSSLIIERRGDWFSCSLLSWQNESEGVGRLIHSLKGPGDSDKFSYFSKLLTRKLFLHPTFKLNLRAKLILVPAPARNILEPDHASFFANELAKCTGGEVKNLLRRESLEEQKGLDLASRKKTRLLPMPVNGLEVGRSEAHIFFIDDLIVSGGTAEAAYLALGKPKYFTVLTLATRPRLQNLKKVAINSDA